MKYTQYFLDEAKKIHADVVALRRHFHMYPEVSAKEFKTAEKLEEEIKKLGLTPRRVGETGVYTEIHGTGEGNKTIVLRADIDALAVTEEHICEYTSRHAGVMHACGHDAHTASLMGAVRLLAENRNLFGGTVRVHFQQGEEIGYGARVFIDEGLVDGADRTFGIHVASKYDAGKIALIPGPNNASVDWFRIRVTGKSAHVSTPHLGVDAAYIAAQIMVSAQAIITRRTSPMDNVLIGIGKVSAGTAYNIVASDAEMEGTIRCLTPETRAFAKSQLEILAKSIASSFGGEATLEWKDYTSPLINDDASAKEAQKVARELFGEENVITSGEPSLGGDDFAEYILKVPGVYAYVGSRNPDVFETGVAMHNCHFDIDESCLLVGSSMYAAYAVAFLNGEV